VVDFYEREIEKCGGQILKNITVRKITWREGSVEVWAQEVVAGQPPTAPPEFLTVPRPVIPATEGFRKFAAEAVIVALPLAVLKANEVQFEPPLPVKLEAVSKMEVGNVAKITFTFNQPVWEEFGFILAPDEAIPTWWSDSRRLSITGWAGGPKADALVKLLPEELEHLGLGILYKILPRHAADLRQNFVVSHYWNWAVDPHVRGAYCYIPVGGSHLPQQLAEPVAGTLFFAGEALATETQTGTVFGALKTGLRAAAELLSV
jgi:monoamine oxidase